MDKIYWVGIKESEISTCKDIFEGSITYNGSGINGNISYTKEYENIKNYNNDSTELDNYVKNTILEILEDNPEAKFMFYNSYYAYSLGGEILKHTVCLNHYSVLGLLRDKMKMRLWLSEFVPVLKTIPVSSPDCSIDYFKKLFPEYDSFILQGCTGAGGNDTYIINANTFSAVKSRLDSPELYIVSPKLEDAYSVNIHVLVNGDFKILPGSVQIVLEDDNRMVYHGADFIEYHNIPQNILKDINHFSKIIATKVVSLGYRGIFGIDYIVSGDSVYFLEINARFQSSSSLINRAFAEVSLPSLQGQVINMFEHSEYIPSDMNVNIAYSNFIIDKYPKYGFFDEYIENAVRSVYVEEVLYDGYSSKYRCEDCASMFSLLFHTNIISINPNGRLNVHENIQPYLKRVPCLKSHQDFLALKAKLFAQGVQITKAASKNFQQTGLRSGTYSSIDVYFDHSMIINCPINLKLCDMSPFFIDYSESRFFLKYADEFISEVFFDTDETYKEKITSTGFSLGDISFLATDRLRIHHSLGCHFKSISVGCRFCDVPPASGADILLDVQEAIDWHLEHSDFRHILIGGGSRKREQESQIILDIIRYIRKRTDKSIYLMSLPPIHENILEEYFEAGVNEIAFNIELFDRKTARRYMYGKSSIPLEQYQAMLLKAVSLWGDTGKVKSMLIYGLEADESFLDGIKWLCYHGVQPVISVFRPLPDTDLSESICPSSSSLYEIFEEILKISRETNVLPGPSCVYCQNNTLSLPFDTLVFPRTQDGKDQV